MASSGEKQQSGGGFSTGFWGARNSAGVNFAASLNFENIEYGYQSADVLRGISLDVDPGEILCLLGPSGSGKTTLLRIAAGLERPRQGTVRINNQVMDDAVTHVPPEKRGVGLVFQDFALFPHMTVIQNVMFGLSELPRADASTRAMTTLERVGMAKYADTYPHQISGGEQQRVALARALAPRPGVILMDEPFSGLDARLRDSIRDQTAALLRETRSTAIIVTHDPEEALRVGDHIALMKDGKLVQFGTGDELFYNPINRFAAEFFSEVNVFEGKVANGCVTTPFGNVETEKLQNDQAVEICIRQSDLVVKPDPEEDTPLAASILSRSFAGMVELLELEIDGHSNPVRLRLKAGLIPEGTRRVAVSVKPEHILVFGSANG